MDGNYEAAPEPRNLNFVMCKLVSLLLPKHLLVLLLHALKIPLPENPDHTMRRIGKASFRIYLFS